MRKIFLAGEWKLGRGAPGKSYFPADGSLNAKFSTASKDDVEEAINKAHDAWQKPAWRNALPIERARILYRVADIIERRSEELAALQTRDNGKPLAETRGLVMSAANTARYFAAALETIDGELTNQRDRDTLTFSVHEPIGVVAAITPWNSPIASEVQKLAPAIAAGNAVILKPAEVTSLIALEIAAIFEEAGLPKGLLSVLPGRGSIVGEAIITNPLVRKISFTGGTSTGKHIATVAASRLATTSLELGGKSPTIVLNDADMELALNGVIFGIFSSSGQACIAGSRLFVHSSIFDEFMERLLAKTRSLRVGHPEDEQTQMGPLINKAHMESVHSYVEKAKKEGGKILMGGAPLDGGIYSDGNYYPPTIITGLSNHASVCQDEIFGPVLIVMPFDSEQELVELANDSIYGLAAGIWTENYRNAWRLARRLDAGVIWINTYKKFSISTPFGGFKESGLGREKGRLSILSYMQQKSIYLGLSEQPNPWCDS